MPAKESQLKEREILPAVNTIMESKNKVKVHTVAIIFLAFIEGIRKLKPAPTTGINNT